MAVAQTGAIYKAMTIDGESSRTYGVYITGQAVYNAPEREVEMVSVPGRNGQLAIDKGRFENIEVTYPAGIYADTEEDFAEAVSNFRNFLCSRSGYVRIEDEYNPNEYRMGIYKSGLEVETAGHKAGEFEIIFDCKPQRWLTDGEAAVTVDSGDVISNPMLFESSPLLEVEGYGNITLNDYNISLTNEVFGHVVLATSELLPATLNPTYYESGDAISVKSLGDVTIVLKIDSTYSGASDYSGLDDIVRSGNNLIVTASRVEGDTFTAGTSRFVNKHLSFAYETIESGTTRKATAQIQLTLRYTAGAETIGITASVYLTPIAGYSAPTFIPLVRSVGGKANEISAESTTTILGHPTYFDCDIGEAYKIESGEVISLNAYIDLGSDLPKLASGANTITFDNTITSLKVEPRWWKI